MDEYLIDRESIFVCIPQQFRRLQGVDEHVHANFEVSTYSNEDKCVNIVSFGFPNELGYRFVVFVNDESNDG